MSLFRVFDISSAAMKAQSQRLNVVASNMANADSATSTSGQPYRAKQVVFEAIAMPSSTGSSVRVKEVVEDPSPPRLQYDPKHPLADANGYVAMPNVSVVDEMVNMISASRSYQTNADIMNTAKSMLIKTLALGQ